MKAAGILVGTLAELAAGVEVGEHEFHGGHAEFRMHVHDGMTVLEALHQLKAEQTPNLAYRSSCRMGVCGSCGMFVNDLPMLACQTQVLALAQQPLGQALQAAQGRMARLGAIPLAY